MLFIPTEEGVCYCCGVT